MSVYSLQLNLSLLDDVTFSIKTMIRYSMGLKELDEDPLTRHRPTYHYYMDECFALGDSELLQTSDNARRHFWLTAPPPVYVSRVGLVYV